jgi:F-type H+-transporting ATPase subunit b
MATGLFLATEAHGVGLNLNLFETNILNLGIVTALVFIFGRKFLTKTLGERRSQIEAAIADAEKQQKQAATALTEAKKQLADAQAQAAKITQEAAAGAEVAYADILAKAAQDVAILQQIASQDASSEQDKAIAELRQRVVNLAIAKAEANLPTMLNNAKQTKLVERSISLVGNK